MFGSDSLEVAIGLVFVYVVLSLVASTVMEVLSQFLNKRGKVLRLALLRLLSDSEQAVDDKFYQHALIRPLWRGKRLPSYIPVDAARQALLDLVAADPADVEGKAGGTAGAADLANRLKHGDEHQELRSALRILVQGGQGSIDKANEGIDAWLDQVLQRTGGVYRRWTQIVLVILGVGLSVALDADTLRIGRNLYSQPALRGAIVKAADRHVETEAARQVEAPADPDRASLPEVPGKFMEEHREVVQRQLASIRPVVGWTEEEWARISGEPGGRPDPWTILEKMLGLSLTAVAVAMGAPFWFDLLQRLVNMRSSAKPGGLSQPATGSPQAGGGD